MTEELAIGVIVMDGSGPRLAAHRDVEPRDAIRAAWLGAMRSPNTRAAYLRDSTEWFIWCDQHNVDVLTAPRYQVDAWIESLISAGLQRSTINRKVTAVSSFYTYGSRDPHLCRFVPANPAAVVTRPPGDTDTTTVGLEREEVEALLLSAKARGPVEYALVAVLLLTGLRVSELCGATTADLAETRGEVTVRVTRKRGRRQHVLIPEMAANALRAHIGTRRGPLLVIKNKGIDRKQADYRIKVCARQAGIAKKVTPHVLRHTFATMALDGDPVNDIAPATLRQVQDGLGHVDPRTTLLYDRARDRIDDSPGHVVGAMLRGGFGPAEQP